MKRKVIQLAGTTYVVSLPLKWIKENNIKKRDELDLDVSKNYIIINLVNSKKEGESKEIILSDHYPERYIKSSINNLIRKGVTELKINFDSPKIITKIQLASNNNIGYELINQSKKYCVLKNVSGIHEEEFDNLFRRLFLLVIFLAEESYNQINNHEILDLQQFQNIKNTIEKLMNSCFQILNLNSESHLPKNKFIYLIVFTLEKIANEIIYLIKTIAENKIILEKNILDYYKLTLDYLREFYQSYYKRDPLAIVKLTATKDELINRGQLLMKNVSTPEPLVIHHLLNIIRRIYDLSGPFLGEIL